MAPTASFPGIDPVRNVLCSLEWAKRRFWVDLESKLWIKVIRLKSNRYLSKLSKVGAILRVE